MTKYNKSHTSAVTKPVENNPLTQMLARQMTNYFTGPKATPEEYDKPVNIVTARNGVFRVVPTPIGLFKTQLAETNKDVVIPALDPMEAGVELRIPKIPFKYWLQVLQFYKDVHAKDGTEASVLFFWNHESKVLPKEYTDKTPVKGITEDGQFIIYCPEQENSASLSDFTGDTMVEWLREHTTPLLETHSHHTMDAFWSGTDDDNENMTQFYGVYGHITSAEPKMLFRYVSGEDKIDIPYDILFDKPTVTKTTSIEIEGETFESATEEVYNGPWPKVEYPADWMEQHTKKTYVYGGYTGGAYGKTYGQGTYGGNAYTQGKGTQQGGAYGQQGYSEWADQDGYYYGRHGYEGAAQTDGQTGVKKNDTTPPATKGSLESVMVDTDTASVELIVDEIISEGNIETIKDIIKLLSKYGYDHAIAAGLKEFDEQIYL